MADLHPQAIRRPLAKCAVGDAVLRAAKQRDVATLCGWQGRELAGGAGLVARALLDAADDAAAENGIAFVLVAPSGERAGAFAIEVPYLTLFYLAPEFRGFGHATRTALQLFDHFFASEPDEPVLIQEDELLGDAAVAATRLGFMAGRLTRATWATRRPELLARGRSF